MSRKQFDKVKKDTPNAPDEIFESIHRVMHLIRSKQYQVLRDCPYQLTHMEDKILGFFARHPGATLSDLAADSGRDKGQLARLIKTLRAHDLLSAKEDANDKRSVRLQLTREGSKVHATLRRELKHATEIAVRNLTADDRAQLVRLLHQLRANME